MLPFVYFEVQIEKVWREEEQEGFLVFTMSSNAKRCDSIPYVIDHYTGRELILYQNEVDLAIAHQRAIKKLKEDYERVSIGWDKESERFIFA